MLGILCDGFGREITLSLQARVERDEDGKFAHWYVARNDGEEVARVRIPSHLIHIEDIERREFLFREVAARLAEKCCELGFGKDSVKVHEGEEEDAVAPLSD